MNDDPEWNESYYFNFHDADKDMTLFMRIGNKPNKNEKSMFLFLMDPNTVSGIRMTVPYDGKLKTCGNLSFTETENRCWKLRYSGAVMDMKSNPPTPSELLMDVSWCAENPLMDYSECVDEEKRKMSSKVASEHYEQFGHAKGIISLNGKEYSVDACGERDFSRGVRDWGSPKMWMWINGRYSEDEGFNITKLSTDAGDVDAGFFCENGTNNPLVLSEIDVDSSAGIPTGFSMILTDKYGKKYNVDGRIIRHAALPFSGSKDMLLIETISETEWNGKIGYGIAEFLIPAPKP